MKKIVLTLLVIITTLTAKCDFDFWGVFNNKTRLEIKVVDHSGTAVGGAKITLYNTKEDYIKEKNPVVESEYTTKTGDAKFTELKPQKYFIVVRKEKMDNSGKNPIINTLKEGVVNKVIIVII